MNMLPLVRSQKGDDARLTRYLLGEISPRRRARLEVRLLADEDLFQRLLLAEDDLVDAYARGELSPARRSALESRVLASPGSRQRVTLARELAAAADAAPRPARLPEKRGGLLGGLGAMLRGQPLVPALVTAALVVVVALQLDPESTSGVRGETSATVTLLPSVRSAAARLPTLELTDDTEEVLLQVEAEGLGFYPGVRARLSTSRGMELWSSGEISSGGDEGGSVLELRPPVSVFEAARAGRSRDRWILDLEGLTADGSTELVEVYELEVRWRE